MEKNRNASASIFGWQFQINVAIYMMFKYFKDFKEIKVEGKSEDIEILLNNKNKIYAQAKSKEKIDYDDTRSYTEKLKSALSSLSDVKTKDVEKLVYISNLEPNPLRSDTKEFELVTFLNYDELLLESKAKIDNQIKSIGEGIDTTKLVIAVIPFKGEDKANRQKYITKQLENFLDYVASDLIPSSKSMLEKWEAEFLHNATQSNPSITIKREDVLWRLLVCILNKNNIMNYDSDMKVDEEEYQCAIEKYSKFISYQEGKFKIFNKITSKWILAKQQNSQFKIIDFINENEDEIYNIVFDDNKNAKEEIIERVCSKIIAKRIILRKNQFVDIVRRSDEYEN